jgi:hypothetical protein
MHLVPEPTKKEEGPRHDTILQAITGTSSDVLVPVFL